MSKWMIITAACAAAVAAPALGQSNVAAAHKNAWSENCGWTNWADAGATAGAQGVRLEADHLRGYVWGENIGWVHLGNGGPYANTTGLNYGVNRDPGSGELSGLAWGENVGWINFSGGAMATPPNPARYDAGAVRLRGYAWGENIGWINLDSAVQFVAFTGQCGTSDFDGDGDYGTDADIQAFFACLGGSCCATCFAGGPDFNGDGDTGTDADIEAFFRVLAGAPC